MRIARPITSNAAVFVVGHLEGAREPGLELAAARLALQVRSRTIVSMLICAAALHGEQGDAEDERETDEGAGDAARDRRLEDPGRAEHGRDAPRHPVDARPTISMSAGIAHRVPRRVRARASASSSCVTLCSISPMRGLPTLSVSASVRPRHPSRCLDRSSGEGAEPADDGGRVTVEADAVPAGVPSPRTSPGRRAARGPRDRSRPPSERCRSWR